MKRRETPSAGRGPFPFAASAIFLFLIGGCGKVESLEIPNRPSLDDFEFVQDALRVTGCSEDGCHAVTVGDFRVSPSSATGVAFTDEFQLTRRFVNLRKPEESRLLTVSLEGTEDSFQHPICFQSTDACTYQILLTWISALGPQDPSPAELGCEPEPRSCQSDGTPE